MDNSIISNSPLNMREVFDELFELDYADVDDIKAIEQKIYQHLQKHQDDTEALITLAFVQTMIGNRVRATALVNKIWEIGGTIKPFFELMYIENLLNLGLNEMAGILLKPRFEQLSANIDYFYPVMLKLSLQIGGLKLLERLQNSPQKPDNDADDLFLIADFYQQSGYANHFKAVQKIILENCLDNLCGYEYEVYDIVDMPSLEIMIYSNLLSNTCERLQTVLHDKITAYWHSCNLEQPDNFEVSVQNVSYHSAWQEAEETIPSSPDSF